MVGKRGNKWYAKVYRAGRQEWLGTFDRERDAKEAERKGLERRAPASRLTCAAYADHWLEENPRRAGATRRTYKYALEPFKRDFEGVRLAAVDRPMARAWALRHRDSARVVRTMFGDALRDGLLHDNPFSQLRLETPRGRKDLEALTYEQVDELADVALEVHGEYGPTFRALVLFAADTGIRPGELYVLERSDVGEDEVQVRQSLSATGEVKAPKNGQPRTVVLPPRAREALRRMPTPMGQWLFTTQRGRRLSKSSLYTYWTPVRARFGRPDLEFYALRHYCATELLERGVSPNDVAVQLGHTDGGRLVQVLYGHPSENAARERLKRAFRPAAPLRVANREQRAGESA